MNVRAVQSLIKPSLWLVLVMAMSGFPVALRAPFSKEFQRAVALQEAGHNSEAAKLFRLLQEQAPDDPEVKRHLELCLLSGDKEEVMMQSLKSYLDLNPKDDELQRLSIKVQRLIDSTIKYREEAKRNTKELEAAGNPRAIFQFELAIPAISGMDLSVFIGKRFNLGVGVFRQLYQGTDLTIWHPRLRYYIRPRRMPRWALLFGFGGLFGGSGQLMSESYVVQGGEIHAGIAYLVSGHFTVEFAVSDASYDLATTVESRGRSTTSHQYFRDADFPTIGFGTVF